MTDEQKPVAAWMHPDGRVVPAATMETAKRDGGAMLSSLAGYTIPLAAPTAPAAVPPRPLTYAEIMSIAYDCNALPEVITDASMRVFVRAIERAHGIGDKP